MRKKEQPKKRRIIGGEYIDVNGKRLLFGPRSWEAAIMTRGKIRFN